MNFTQSYIYKKKAPENPEVQKKTHKKRTYLYPVFLILFILITLFLFIFGENGLYSHKRKLQVISNLTKENHHLGDKLQTLKENVKNLRLGQAAALEKEARYSSYKKSDEKLIKLYHQGWIETLSRIYEKRYDPKDEIRTLDESFLDGHKTIIAVLICLALATLMTSILTRKKT